MNKIEHTAKNRAAHVPAKVLASGTNAHTRGAQTGLGHKRFEDQMRQPGNGATTGLPQNHSGNAFRASNAFFTEDSDLSGIFKNPKNPMSFDSDAFLNLNQPDRYETYLPLKAGLESIDERLNALGNLGREFKICDKEKSQQDAKTPLESSEVNGVNLDTLGATINKPGEYPGYERTDYGYVQSDPTQPGPDYLLLIEDPKKMTDQQKHYMRNIELAGLIREEKIPTHLDEFMKSDYYNYRLLPEGQSKYHMNGEDGGYNVKLVNDRSLHGYKKGALEVVYNTVTGKLDLSAENMPTINDTGPDKKWDHLKDDVVPYWSYKNTPNDSTGWLKRLTGPFPFSIDQSDADKKAAYDTVRKYLGEKQQ